MRATIHETVSSTDLVHLNGVDGASGRYLVDPFPADRVVALARAEGAAPAGAAPRWLGALWRMISGRHYGLPRDVAPDDVRQTGWAVVFHCDEAPAVRAALRPLVERRRAQAGDALVKELEYRDGETVSAWLGRHDVGHGAVMPERVPFYLLLVGSPERIPFAFGHLLDVEYAVGRVEFDDAAGYRAYAESVVGYETAAAMRSAREAVFFATCHQNDPATQLSARELVTPLCPGDGDACVARRYGFAGRPLVGDAATKAALGAALAPAGGRPPAFLFTATHGLGWSGAFASQYPAQGALLCADWAGGPVRPEHRFAAADVVPDVPLDGLVSFHFGCYSAGTPKYDRFVPGPDGRPRQIADRAYLAALPKALLGRPRGALACIGHVERTWSYSIKTEQTSAQLLPFQNAVGSILSGDPVGLAMKDFNERYAALSAVVAGMLDQLQGNRRVSADELRRAWLARNDAEGLTLVGDPAARVRVRDIAT